MEPGQPPHGIRRAEHRHIVESKLGASATTLSWIKMIIKIKIKTKQSDIMELSTSKERRDHGTGTFAG
jgi:hypothetical protein